MDVLVSPYELPKSYDAPKLKKPHKVHPATTWDGIVGCSSPETLLLHPTPFTATFLDAWIRYAVARPVQALAFSDAFQHINNALGAVWQPPDIAGEAKVGLFPPSSLLALDLAAKHKDELRASRTKVLLVLRRVNIRAEYSESDSHAAKDISSLLA